MFRGGYNGEVNPDLMSDREFEEYLRRNQGLFDGNDTADYTPKPKPVMIPVYAGPYGIRNTGDVAVIAKWLEDNGSIVPKNVVDVLTERCDSMLKIEELSRKADAETAQGRPGKTLPRITETENGFILPDINLSDYQHSYNGCWSCAYQLLLQSRGVNLTQFDIRNFRPQLTIEEAYSIEDGSVFDRDSVITMNEDRMSNPFESPDLAIRTVPNCAMHAVSFTSYRDLRDEAQNITPDAYLDNTADFAMVKISEAILEDHSPVALLVGNHYVTVVGIDGNDLLFKDSNGIDRTVDPNKTYRRNIRDFLSPILTMGYGKGVELNWISDIHIAKDGKTIYGLPEEGVYMDESGAVAFDPGANIGGLDIEGFRCQIGRQVIPRMHELATEGIAAREKAYLPAILNKDFLINEAKTRTESDEAALSAIDREHGVGPARQISVETTSATIPAPASDDAEKVPAKDETSTAPVKQPQASEPEQRSLSQEDFRNLFMDITASSKEMSRASSAVGNEQKINEPWDALKTLTGSRKALQKDFYAKSRLLLTANPVVLDSVLRQSLTPEQYERFDTERRKSIDFIVKGDKSGLLTADNVRYAQNSYLPNLISFIFTDDETSKKVIDQMYNTLSPGSINRIVNDVRGYRDISERDDRYEYLIESECARLTAAIPKDVGEKAALAKAALERANDRLKCLSRPYADDLSTASKHHDSIVSAGSKSRAAQFARNFDGGRFDGIFTTEGFSIDDVSPERSRDVEALMSVDVSLSEKYGDSVGRIMHKLDEMFSGVADDHFAGEEPTKKYAFRNLLSSENELVTALEEMDKRITGGGKLTDGDYDRITELEKKYSKDRDDILAIAGEVSGNFADIPFTEPGNVDITRTFGAPAEFAEDKSMQSRINGMYSCYAFCRSNGIKIDDFLKDPVGSVLTTAGEKLESMRISGIADPAKSVGSNLAAIVNMNATEPINKRIPKQYDLVLSSGRAMDALLCGETDPDKRSRINLVADRNNDLMALRGNQIAKENYLYDGVSGWQPGQLEFFMSLAVKETKDISYTRIDGAEYDRNGVRHDFPILDDYINNARTMDYRGMIRRFDANMKDFRRDVAAAGDSKDQAAYIQSIKDKMILGAQEGFIKTLELRREKDRTRTDYREMEKAIRSMADEYAADLSPTARQALKDRAAEYDMKTAPLERRDNTMAREGGLHITDIDARLLMNMKDNLDYKTIPGLSKYKKDIESLDFSLLAPACYCPEDLPGSKTILTASGETLRLFSDSVQKTLEPAVRQYHDVAEKILADRELMEQQPVLGAYLQVIREYTDNSLSDRPDALDSWNSPIRKFQIDEASRRQDIPFFEKDDFPSVNFYPKYAFLKGSAELFEMEKAGSASRNDPYMYNESAWSTEISRKANDLENSLIIMQNNYRVDSESFSLQDLKKVKESLGSVAANYGSGHTPDAIYLRTVTFDTAKDAVKEIKRLCPEKDDAGKLSPEAQKLINGFRDLENWYRGPFLAGMDAKQVQQRGELLCDDVKKLLTDLTAYRDNASKNVTDRTEKQLMDRLDQIVQGHDLASLAARVDEQYHLENKVRGAELSEKLTPFYEMMKDTKEGWFGHGNSREYRNMMSTLEKVISLSKRAEAAINNPAVSPLNAGERKALGTYLGELDKACEAYLKGKEKERSTQTGKDRYAGALGVLNLIDPDKADKYIRAANEVRKTKISFKQLTDTAEEKREERKKRDRTKQAAAMKDKKQTKQQEQVKPEGRN
ncbi:MAG: hypothetical protein K6C95_00580 [Lachnospiraceae bacterium]|nr:hypothetical protein [Lachnospiraceae bacterium]